MVFVYKLNLINCIIIYYFLLIIAYQCIEKNDIFDVLNCISILFIIPYYISFYLYIKIFVIFIPSIIGFYFYKTKKYKLVYNNIYIFGHHELYHLFTSISSLLGLYILNNIYFTS